MNKNGTDGRESNLKREDSRRLPSGMGISVWHNTVSGRKKLSEIASDGEVSNIRVRKKLPLAVDIIVGVIMLLIVIAVIVVSYMLFRYYSNDYETVDVTYTAVISGEGIDDAVQELKGKELYMDASGNTVYFGKITDVRAENGNTGKIIITVSVAASYRSGEGYSLGNSRIAVGSSFNLRYLEKTVAVSVVELAVRGGN